MVKKRVRLEKASLKTWNEVDEALKVIAEAQNEISIVESTMNMQIDAIKSVSDEKIKGYRDEIKKQELLIKEFTTGSKDELDGKSKELTFGKVGFRKSTKVVLPKALERVIASLKKNGMEDCVVLKETVNKDMLKTYPEKDILKVGASLKVEDAFWYETKAVEISKVS
ncbi:MAG: host-nuclease inhibitor Gam family protein [Acetatifactor sp.]